MSQTIDYYFAPVSPWAYLGHQRLDDLARAAGATVNVRPIDLGGQVFPISGGLPLPKRAPQRQAYRLVELKRFSDWLELPMNVQPKHFPVSGDDAARLILAVRRHDGGEAAMRLSGAVMRAVWAEDRDVSARSTLLELLAEQGLARERSDDALDPQAQRDYDEATQQAIAAGVFGAPSYVIDGELFWGQDRLDFVERRLMRQR